MYISPSLNHSDMKNVLGLVIRVQSEELVINGLG